MRILVFGMSGKLTGGIETFLLNMSACMSSECIFDYVITDDFNIHSAAVRKNRGKSFHVTPVKKNPLRSLTELHKVIRKNRKNHPVAYFNLFSMVHVIPVILCRINGYRVVLHAHNSRLQQKSRLYEILHLAGRALLSGIKCQRLTNSDASAAFMFGEKVKARLVYNAIDVERFRYNPAVRDVIRKEYDITDQTVVGFCGRLSSPKNPLFLIRIFKEFHAMKKESILMIAGDGELREVTEKKVKEYGLERKVIFLGNVKETEKIYQAFDLFLMPSRFEGLGIALVEAQTAGLPVVTSADVVPDIATVTDRCRRVALNKPAKFWAAESLELYQQFSDVSRNDTYKIIQNSDFNIRKESKKLERLLVRDKKT